MPLTGGDLAKIQSNIVEEHLNTTPTPLSQLLQTDANALSRYNSLYSRISQYGGLYRIQTVKVNQVVCGERGTSDVIAEYRLNYSSSSTSKTIISFSGSAWRTYFAGDGTSTISNTDLRVVLYSQSTTYSTIRFVSRDYKTGNIYSDDAGDAISVPYITTNNPSGGQINVVKVGIVGEFQIITFY